MEYFWSLLKTPSKKTTATVAQYDIPFVTPSRGKINIPPKPSRISGKCIAPKTNVTSVPSLNVVAPEFTQSADVSAILFGCPVENVKMPSPAVVRYPTNLLFPSKPSPS